MLVILLAAQLAVQSSPAWAVQHLDLVINLDYAERGLTGRGLMTFQNHGQEAVRRVPLQTGRLMQVTSVRDVHGAALRYTQDVVRFADWPAMQVNQVWIELPAAVPPRSAVTIRVDWEGILVGYQETGMMYVRERIDSAFTLLREETGAFPVVGVPSVAAMRAAPREDFTFQARITVPAHQVVATGGRLVERRLMNDSVAYTFAGATPVPFLNIAIAPYRLAERSGIRVYHFPEDSAGAAALLVSADSALDLLESWFGATGDSLDLAIIEIPPGYGSQASLTAGVIQDAAAFRSKSGLHQLYHELTHFWNVRSTDRPAARWEEGLASFLEMLLAHQLDGGPDAVAQAQGHVPAVLERFGRDTANANLRFVDYGKASKTGFSYSVGQLMFATLYAAVGADEFNRLVGGYYQRYKQTGGTTAQLIDYLHSQSKHNLAAFTRDWLLSTRWFTELSRGATLSGLARTYAAVDGRIPAFGMRKQAQ